MRRSEAVMRCWVPNGGAEAEQTVDHICDALADDLAQFRDWDTAIRVLGGLFVFELIPGSFSPVAMAAASSSRSTSSSRRLTTWSLIGEASLRR